MFSRKTIAFPQKNKTTKKNLQSLTKLLHSPNKCCTLLQNFSVLQETLHSLTKALKYSFHYFNRESFASDCKVSWGSANVLCTNGKTFKYNLSFYPLVRVCPSINLVVHVFMCLYKGAVKLRPGNCVHGCDLKSWCWLSWEQGELNRCVYSNNPFHYIKEIQHGVAIVLLHYK